MNKRELFFRYAPLCMSLHPAQAELIIYGAIEFGEHPHPHIYLQMIMCSPPNNLILYLFGKIIKKRTIASDANHHVPIVIRIFLGIPQGFRADDVKLTVIAAEFKIGSNQIGHAGQTALAFDGRGQQLEVKQGATGM